MKSFKSRKLVVFGVVFVLAVLNKIFEIVDLDTLNAMVALVVGWLVSQGIADAGSRDVAVSAEKAAGTVVDAVKPGLLTEDK